MFRKRRETRGALSVFRGERPEVHSLCSERGERREERDEMCTLCVQRRDNRDVGVSGLSLLLAELSSQEGEFMSEMQYCVAGAKHSRVCTCET